MLTMIYMTRIQNMSFFLLKVKYSFRLPPRLARRALCLAPLGPRRDPFWPPHVATRQAPRLAPIGHPVRPRLALRLATQSGHPCLATPTGHPSSNPTGPRPTPRPAAVESEKNK
jgi:hypothetical protein